VGALVIFEVACAPAVQTVGGTQVLVSATASRVGGRRAGPEPPDHHGYRRGV
jgi:hypothetical protein